MPDPKTVAELKKELEMQALRHEQKLKERDAERDIKQKAWETKWGGILKLAGWVMLGLGIAAHCCTNLPFVKDWSKTILALGGALLLGGLGIQKTVQIDKYLNVAFAIMAGGLLMYLFRNWSVSHIPVIRNLWYKMKVRAHNYEMTDEKESPSDV